MVVHKEPKMIERVYGKIGPIYNFIYGKLLFNEGRNVAIRFLELKPGAHVLEVGVGTGLTLPLYPHDCEVTGIDLSESMLKEAEDLMADRGITNAKVRKMDATKLEFAENSFDGVLGNLFISATTYPERSLKEMQRVCKPGGIIVLMNHFRSENRIIGAVENAMNPVAERLGFTSNLEMEPLLSRLGMRVRKSQKVNMLNLWTAVSMVNEK